MVIEVLLELKIEPNPLAVELSKIGTEFIDDLISLLESEGSSSNNAEVLKALTLQPELLQCFCNKKAVNKLAD